MRQEESHLLRELFELQYDAGTTTLENLLEIQNQYFRAQDAEVQARGLAARSVVDLCRALGGGWEQDVPASDNASEESKSAVASSRAAEASRSPLVRERDEKSEKAEKAETDEQKTSSKTETASAPAQP